MKLFLFSLVKWIKIQCGKIGENLCSTGSIKFKVFHNTKVDFRYLNILHLKKKSPSQRFLLSMSEENLHSVFWICNHSLETARNNTEALLGVQHLRNKTNIIKKTVSLDKRGRWKCQTKQQKLYTSFPTQEGHNWVTSLPTNTHLPMDFLSQLMALQLIPFSFFPLGGGGGVLFPFFFFF